MTSLRFLTICAVFTAYAAAETIRVRASVHCGFQKKTMSPEIALMDEDFSGVFLFGLFDSDDVLDETKVDYGEHFTLDGSEVEVFSIEPYLRIRHQCFTMDREDILDLSSYARDPEGIVHLGHIVLNHSGYVIRPFST